MRKSSICLAILLILSLVALTVGCSKTAEAPKFPTKQVELIVPYAAGGGTDLVARALANGAKDKLGQPMVVVNKVGGGGAVGMTDGFKAKADGYTATMITVELVTLPHLGLAQLNYQDFEPLMMVNSDPAAITVLADAPWKTLQEFLDYAKQNPKKVRVGNSGTGAIWHLAAAAVEEKTGVQFTHVPFNGANPAVTSLLGGNIEAVSVSTSEVATQVQAGKMRILGVMSDKRVKIFPDAPTLKEQKIDLTIATWRGLAVPKGTPAPVVAVLQDAFKKAMDEKAFVEYMDKAGLGISYLSGEEFKTQLKTTSEYYGILIEKLGLKKK